MNNGFDFNHRVVLQKEVQQIGSECGEVNSRYENIAEVWANINPISAKQTFFRMKNDIEISHVITIRYREDARCCKRIMFNNRCFEILGTFCPKEDCNFLVFNAKEVLNY